MTFEEHWQKSLPQLRGIARRFCEGDQDNAEDLLQQTALRSLTYFATYSHEQPFIAWASVIMRRLMLDQMRLNGRRPLTRPLDEKIETMCGAVEGDQHKVDDEIWTETKLEALRWHVSPLNWEVFMLAFENQSYEEIAKHLRISVHMVRSRLNRARASLREALKAA